MNPLALARRYRPRTFQTLVGQEATLQALMNALDTGRLHHAYLLTGTRGVGKTTIARILAKCLNCEEGISSKPCGTCSTCLAIDAGSFVDLLEVDAASRTKVEDTRALLENVQYRPTRGRFKIYLIDEVHMLSGHSFNALLKTLEEPPEHVKFILATTDPQKLPVTVLSRCLQFHLWRLSIAKISGYLENVLQEEKATFELEALEEIARAADGSMRDALSLLDQALAYGNGRVDETAVRSMLGLSEIERLIALLKAVIDRDCKAMFSEILRLAEGSVDFSGILTEFLTLLHQVAIAKAAKEALDESLRGRTAILTLAESVSSQDIQLFYQIGLHAQRDLPYAPSPKMGFEMALLRMIAFQPVRINARTVNVNIEKVNVEKRETTKIEEPVVKVALKDAKETEDWNHLVPKLNLTGLIKVLAQHCTVAQWSTDRIQLVLEEAQKPLLNKRNEERLRDALSLYLGRTITLKIEAGKGIGETLATQNQRLQEKNHQMAHEAVQNDLTLQKIVQVLDAKIEQVSVIEDIKG